MADGRLRAVVATAYGGAEVLEVVERSKRSAWMVVFTSHVVDLQGDVLYLSFPSERDAESFKKPGPGDTVSELLRRAIVEVRPALGFARRYRAVRSDHGPRDEPGRFSLQDGALRHDDAARV